MKTQILYITEHLSQLLHKDQLLSIEKACLDSGYEILILKDLFAKIKIPDVIIGSETCLLSQIKNEDFVPQVNFILYKNGKDKILKEDCKAYFSQLRFILGEPPLALLEKILFYTLHFFKNSNTLTMADIFTNNHSNCLTYELKNSKEKETLREQMKIFFTEEIQKKQSNSPALSSFTHIKNLSDVLEEFLMNAIWDANPKYCHLDRTQPIQLLENEKVDVAYLFDGSHYAVSVTDRFGSFDTHAIEKQIAYFLGIQESNTIQEGTSGAGIGMFMILKKISVLIFEVEKGKLTRATAIICIDQSVRDMQKKTRTLFFFEK